MRRREPLVLRPWTLPLLMAALVVPPVAAFALAGPQIGLAVGALEVATVIVLAARARFDEPIEVRGDAGRPRVLVVALEALETPRQAERVADLLGEAESARDAEAVRVLAPATNTRLAHWLSDVGESRFEAQRRLALSLGTLAAGGLDARGHVGDPDAVQAVEDELRDFAATEVLVVGADDAAQRLAAELDRRAPVAVRRLR